MADIKILIADDNDFFSKIIKNELVLKGYAVETLSNGQEALEKAKTFIPDVILLDLIMPIMDGFETLQEIKKNKALSRTKVIIFSNLGQDEDIAQAKQLGADDYIIKKDFSLEEIVSKVEKLIA